MKTDRKILGLVALFAGVGNAVVPTWPSNLDELEDVMFLHTGYKSRGLASHVTPCGFSEFGPGRQTSAEWLRLGFHDMATANKYREPAGGIDGSIAFELTNGDNVGTGFATSLTTLATYMNRQLPMADLIALAVHTSVRACGGPSIAMRGGRIDALVSNSPGVPQTNDGVTVFRNRFDRMGFNNEDMVQMTACGHTLGGVHSANFPAIVLPNTAPDGYQLFDNTAAFDNSIAMRYINGPDTDPLSTGPAVGSRSDKAVFGADANVTLNAMTNPATFNSICSTILQRMIEVKPTAVTLSPVISPYEVKPSIQLTVSEDGTQIKFAGEIRVRTTTGAVSAVQIVYKDRTGGAGGTISATSAGTANGFDDSFTFYAFSADISSASSVSSFTVIVTSASGVTTYNNNGLEFPVQDSVIFQAPNSCLTGGNMKVVAAVRSGGTAPSLIISRKNPRSGGITLPTIDDTTTVLTVGATLGGYTLYSGTVAVSSAGATTFSVTSGTFSDSFKKASSLLTTCAITSPTSSSASATSTSSSLSSFSGISTSSSTTISSTSTSSSSTTSSSSSAPSPSHPARVGAFIFQGCYTEIQGGRALSQARYDNATMTTESCAASCAAYTYFGIEYGQECYCGNTLNEASTLAAIGDCNFLCPGNSLQYCGAGNRMELYKRPVISSSSSASSTLTTSTTTSASASHSATPTVHIVPSVGTYNYHGCWTEATGARALSAAYFPSNALTVQDCVSSCKDYKFAGVEYSQECYCANTFTQGSVIAPDAECLMTCAGDQLQYCGGSNRLNVYINNGKASSSSSSSTTATSVSRTTTASSTSSSSPTSTSLYTSDGCWTDSTGNRALNGGYHTDPFMTISLCESLCASFSVFGVEYGKECFCGNTLSATSTKAALAECSFDCPGYPSQKCGAGDRLSLYRLTVKPSDTTTTPGASTTTLVTSTTTSSGPTSKPTIGIYKYQGCRTEADNNVRALSSGTFFNGTSMTNEYCSERCAGFKYFGTEYGTECYCGNSFNTGSVTAVEADCSFTCPGNDKQFCGAGNRLTVYELIAN